MQRWVGAVLAATCLALAAPALAGARITVAGEGRAEAAPDMAVVRIGVQRRAAEADAALQAASQAAAVLLETLAEAGLEARDIRSSELFLRPVWPSGRDGQPEGFVAGSMVELRLRALEALGPVLAAAVGAGANRLDGVQFALADPQALADLARRRAVADALRRGALYAEAAGVALGPIEEIHEEAAGQPRFPAMRAAELAAADPVPVAPGEIDVSARVTVVFAPAP